jgi:hypothetical protein
VYIALAAANRPHRVLYSLHCLTRKHNPDQRGSQRILPRQLDSSATLRSPRMR